MTNKTVKMTRGLFAASVTALATGHKRLGVVALAAGLYAAERRADASCGARERWQRRRDQHERAERTKIARAARIASAPMLAAGTYGLLSTRPGKLSWVASIGALTGAYVCRAVEKRTSSERAVELGEDPIGYVASASWDWRALARGDGPRVDGDTITMRARK